MQSAIRVHGDNIRRCFLDPLTPGQAAAIRAWSEQTIGRIGPGRDDAEAEAAS